MDDVEFGGLTLEVVDDEHLIHEGGDGLPSVEGIVVPCPFDEVLLASPGTVVVKDGLCC